MLHSNIICSLSFFLSILVSQVLGNTYTSPIHIKTEKQKISFSLKGAYPVSWQACHPSYADAGATVSFSESADSSPLRLTIKDRPELSRQIQQLIYQLEREENDKFQILRFISEPLTQGVYFEKIYKISKHGYQLTFTIRICGEQADQFIKDNTIVLVLSHGRQFVPPPAAGFAGGLEKVTSIYLTDKVHEISHDTEQKRTTTLDKNHWVGFRNRFWALLLRPDKGEVILTHDSGSAEHELLIQPTVQTNEVKFQLYTGTINYAELNNNSLMLTGLLFTHLWFWMRWLCLGLLFLLNGLIHFIGNHGIAIILLSLCVKILMVPLTWIAEKWQKEVNEKKSILQPYLDDIKAKYRGEEQIKRIHEVYKEQGIHTLFSLKSVFGVLIQIPIFIAAYHMLHENIAISGISFLWIEDLARPDSIVKLPFHLPFFGEDLNLLPLLMTGITLLSSWQFYDKSLSPKLLRKQRQNLYWMAFLFFVLFYTFPSGMVLYWTTNNLLSLIKVQLEKNWHHYRKKTI